MEENVAFFSLEPTKDKKGVIGAILVTDDLGMPQEFRVTYPVKPTNLQKRLYGESLLVHIGVTLCGEPLYNALRHKPELLLVSRDKFLILANRIDTEVAHLKRAGEAILVGDDEEEIISKKMSSKSGRYKPINVHFPLDIDDDREEKITSLIEKYFQGIDLLEPFERIKSALDALSEQDERFR
jgi:hypothetical protein